MAKTKTPLPKRILIYLKAPKSFSYGGYDLLQTLLSNHFRFGEMDIFHRHEEPNGKGEKLFSLAAATKTGTFDLANMGAFTCSGLTLFISLTKQKDPLASFDLMIETAEHLITDLGGALLDENQTTLTLQQIEVWRKEIFNTYASSNLELEPV